MFKDTGLWKQQNLAPLEHVLFPAPSPCTLELDKKRAISAIKFHLFLSFSRFHLSFLLVSFCTVVMIHIYLKATTRASVSVFLKPLAHPVLGLHKL